MAKPKAGQSGKNKYVSKGQRRSVSKVNAKGGKERTPYERWVAKREAWRAGKRVVLGHVHVKAKGRSFPILAKDVWGDPAKNHFKMGKGD